MRKISMIKQDHRHWKTEEVLLHRKFIPRIPNYGCVMLALSIH